MVKKIFVFLLSLPIYAYRLLISPLLGKRCRFKPSCSIYTLDALQQHGPVKGLWLACKRIGSCHPFSKKGPIDPVPPLSVIFLILGCLNPCSLSALTQQELELELLPRNQEILPVAPAVQNAPPNVGFMEEPARQQQVSHPRQSSVSICCDDLSHIANQNGCCICCVISTITGFGCLMWGCLT